MKKQDSTEKGTKGKNGKKGKKDNVITIVLVVIILIGLMITLYPTLSDYVNSRHQSKVVAEYDDTVSKMTKQEQDAIIAKAAAYNERLVENGNTVYKPGSYEEYEQILDITGTGIMGYISISKINIELPIYHGTSKSVLSDAAGHLHGSSFPVEGPSVHAVVSAHRGLPSAKLFTNLDKLEVGDTFTITVLHRMYTYQVDQIHIVLPEEVGDLKIEDGREYCTLLTCTPYGVNSHRLLVRGKRIPNEEQSLNISSEASVIDPLVVAAVLAAPIFVALIILVLVRAHKRNKARLLEQKNLSNEME